MLYKSRHSVARHAVFTAHPLCLNLHNSRCYDSSMQTVPAHYLCWLLLWWCHASRPSQVCCVCVMCALQVLAALPLLCRLSRLTSLCLSGLSGLAVLPQLHPLLQLPGLRHLAVEGCPLAGLGLLRPYVAFR